MAIATESTTVVDGGFAWIVMAASFLLQYLSNSIFISYSILMVELSQVFGANRSMVSFGTSVQTGVFCFAGVFMGYLIDKFGCRLVCFFSSIVAASALLLSSFVTNIYALYVTFGVLGGVGCSGLLLTSIVTVQLYFDKRRGFAAAMITVGSSLAAITTTPVYTLLMENLGWRGAMILHAGVVLHGTVCSMLYRPISRAAILKQEGTEDDGREPTDKVDDPLEPEEPKGNLWISQAKTLFCNKGFRLYIIANMLFPFGMLTMYQHTPSRAMYKGMDMMQAALMISVLGFCLLIGQLSTSFLLSFKCTSRNLFVFVDVLAGAATIWISCLASGFYDSAVTTGVYGFFLGSFLAMQPTVMVDIVGKLMAAPANGWLFGFSGLAALCASPTAGWLFDMTGNYDVPFYVTGGIQLLSAVLFLPVFLMGSKSKPSVQCDDLYDNEKKLKLDVIKSDAIYNKD